MGPNTSYITTAAVKRSKQKKKLIQWQISDLKWLLHLSLWKGHIEIPCNLRAEKKPHSTLFGTVGSCV